MSNSNTTTSNCFTTNPSALKIGKTVAYCLIIFGSLVGNSLIVIIVYKNKRMRRPIYFFIVNMATSDLLYPTFLLPIHLTHLYNDSAWFIDGLPGRALCKLRVLLERVSIDVSILSLILIASERCSRVAFPLHSPFFTTKRSFLSILAIWIVAIAATVPGLLAFKLRSHQGQLLCGWSWNETFGESLSEKNYLLVTYVVFIYTPTALLTILYSFIIFKHNRVDFLGQQVASVEVLRARVQENRKVLWLATVVIVLGCILCLVPITVLNLLRRFALTRRRLGCGIQLCSLIFDFLAFSHCAVNPCICFTLNRSFRQGLKKLTCSSVN